MKISVSKVQNAVRRGADTFVTLVFWAIMVPAIGMAICRYNMKTNRKK